MTSTEERLRDALTAVGDTIGPADIPPLRLRPHRRFRPRPRTALAAAAVAAIAAGAFAAIDHGGREPVLTAVAPDPTMSVFLCAKTSTNPSCDRSDATAAQRAAVQARLLSLAQVKSVEYESQQEAWRRFRTAFADSPEITESVTVGEVSAVFRVTLHSPGHYSLVKAAVENMPGVDQVVNDPAPATPPS